ncbi:uncharacterized protein LOC123672130 [Harmonia axyridis]|uniref:uncharacterized protein LOC123672130 n=1 Tax=Harmonia axyridis TaxID=115357 RepID=UPI001E2793E0|nr:uncharacterized protein LOC123672130 [Harmonia axyridis]
MLEIKKPNKYRHFSFPRISWEIFWLLYIVVIDFILLSMEICMNLNINPTLGDLLSSSMFYLHSVVSIQLQQFYVTIQSILLYYSRMFNYLFTNKDICHGKIIDITRFDDLLRSTISEFREAFSSVILIKCVFISSSFLMMILCNLTAELYNETFSLYISIRIFIVCWFLSEVSTILIVIVYNVKIEKQMNIIDENIQNLQIQIGHKYLQHKSVELSLLNARMNKSKFFIFGFFPLDWSLVYGMVAEISTYSVIIIQFREMEMKKS